MTLPGWKSPWQSRSPSGSASSSRSANVSRCAGMPHVSMRRRQSSRSGGRLGRDDVMDSRLQLAGDARRAKERPGRLPISVSRSGPSTRSMTMPSRPSAAANPRTAGTGTPAARARLHRRASRSRRAPSAGIPQQAEDSARLPREDLRFAALGDLLNRVGRRCGDCSHRIVIHSVIVVAHRPHRPPSELRFQQSQRSLAGVRLAEVFRTKRA